MNAAFKGLVKPLPSDLLCKPWDFDSTVGFHPPNNTDITVAPQDGNMAQVEDCFEIVAMDSNPLAEIRQKEQESVLTADPRPHLENQEQGVRSLDAELRRPQTVHRARLRAWGGVFVMQGVGLVVLYQATGVLNLADGAIRAAGAFLTWELIDNDLGPVGLPTPCASPSPV